VKEVVVAMGSGMAHRKEAVVAWSCNAARGKWRWRRPDTKETEGTGETGAHDFFYFLAGWFRIFSKYFHFGSTNGAGLSHQNSEPNINLVINEVSLKTK
jgi:hypothetical protein